MPGILPCIVFAADSGTVEELYSAPTVNKLFLTQLQLQMLNEMVPFVPRTPCTWDDYYGQLIDIGFSQSNLHDQKYISFLNS